MPDYTTMAYGVYYYDDQGNGSGMTGQIQDTGNDRLFTPDIRTTFNGDPTVHPFPDGATPLYAATDYAENVTNRPVYIYNVAGVQQGSSHIWSSVTNLTGLVRLGDYLYALDYDNARIVQITPGTYAETTKTYTFTMAPAGYTAYGVALTEAGGYLYALFMIVDNPWATNPDYQNSVAVKLSADGTGFTEVAVNTGLEKNAFTLVENDGGLYVCCIGGKQQQGGYNAASKLQKITLSSFSTTPTTLMTAADVNNHDFHDITFDGSTAYVLVGDYNSNWSMTGELFSTTNFVYGDRTSISTFSGGVGEYYWGILFTPEFSRLWFAKGNSIELYSAGGSSAGSVPFSSLIGSGDPYTNLNDLAYVGSLSLGSAAKVGGYRTHAQRSATPKALALRSITRGRPEATEEELAQAEDIAAGTTA